MKTTILFLLLLFLATTSYSQVNTIPTPVQEPIPLSKEYYLKKSKSQRTLSRVLVIGGGVLLIVGLGAAIKEGLDGTGKVVSSGLLLGTSLASFTSGIAFGISAKHNRKKAMSAVVDHAPYSQPVRGTFTTQTVPRVGLKITF